MLGDSGSGKTGAIASLAKAGFQIKILDFDNGLDILTDPEVLHPSYLSNISYVSCRDEMELGKNSIKIVKAQAFSSAVKILHDWPEGEKDIRNWKNDTVFVLDSLTSFGNSILDAVLELNNHDKPTLPDWGQAMQEQERFIALLTSPSVKCNVIVNAHIQWVIADNGIEKGFANALGNKLGPNIPRYFNDCFQVSSSGTGPKAKRTINTSISRKIGLKSHMPSKVHGEFDIQTGLAKIFSAMGINVKKED